jgi:transposase
MLYFLRYLENSSPNLSSRTREALNFPLFQLGKGVRDCFQTRRSPLTPLFKRGKETLKAPLFKRGKETLKAPLFKRGKETLKAPLFKREKETLKAPLFKGGWGDLQRLRCFKKGLKTRPSGLGYFPHHVRG